MQPKDKIEIVTIFLFVKIKKMSQYSY